MNKYVSVLIENLPFIVVMACLMVMGKDWTIFQVFIAFNLAGVYFSGIAIARDVSVIRKKLEKEEDHDRVREVRAEA